MIKDFLLYLTTQIMNYDMVIVLDILKLKNKFIFLFLYVIVCRVSAVENIINVKFIGKKLIF
jgi:hypothetical protein